MSKTKFTPGPWRQEPVQLHDVVDGNLVPRPLDEAYRAIVAGSGVYGSGFGMTGFISREDAALIAAAPEMYTLLHHIQFELLGISPLTVKQIGNLLAKASGNEPAKPKGPNDNSDGGLVV